jgi:nitroreductase
VDTFLDIVKERRSIRRFTAQPVEQEKLDVLLEAARWTPSWANTQCWEVIVVADADTKKEMSGYVSPKNPATLACANAPLVLAICGAIEKSGFYNGEKTTIFGDWLLYDLGLFTQTISLTAHKMGLGTVIVGLFDHHAVKKLLAVPDGYEVVALLPLGYPDHAPSAPKRKAVGEFVHHERFSQ